MEDAATLEELRAENVALRERIAALEDERSHTTERLERLQHLLAELPLLVDIFDIRARRSIFKNRDLDVLMGYAPGALEAMGPQPTLYKTVHPDDIPLVLGAINRMMDENNPLEAVTVEYRVRRGDKKPGWFRSEMNAFERTPDGRTLMGLMVTYDVTEAKLAEEALRALNADLDAQVAARTSKLEETNTQLHEENRLRGILAAEAEERAREIRRLGAPVLRVQDDVVAMPIIGRLDAERAESMTSVLLEEISRTGARFAILDLTAVGAIDAETVRQVQRLVDAIALLGADVVISGIGPSIARVMVQEALRMEAVTVRNLREALRYCLQRRRT